MKYVFTFNEIGAITDLMNEVMKNSEVAKKSFPDGYNFAKYLEDISKSSTSGVDIKVDYINLLIIIDYDASKMTDTFKALLMFSKEIASIIDAAYSIARLFENIANGFKCEVKRIWK